MKATTEFTLSEFQKINSWCIQLSKFTVSNWLQTYNFTNKLVINRKLKLPSFSQPHKLHNRIQRHILTSIPNKHRIKPNSNEKQSTEKWKSSKISYFESVFRAGRNENLNEGADELIELRSEPRAINGLGIGFFGGFGGRREVVEEGNEEGLEGEEGFEGVLERRRGGEMGEEDWSVVDVSSWREELVT